MRLFFSTFCSPKPGGVLYQEVTMNHIPCARHQLITSNSSYTAANSSWQASLEFAGMFHRDETINRRGDATRVDCNFSQPSRTDCARSRISVRQVLIAIKGKQRHWLARRQAQPLLAKARQSSQGRHGQALASTFSIIVSSTLPAILMTQNVCET